MWAMRYPLAVAMPVAVALSQIGEFSFMLSDGRPRAGHPDAGRDEHAGGDLDHLDCGQPTDLPGGRPASGRLSARYPSLLKLLQRPHRGSRRICTRSAIRRARPAPGIVP